MKDLKVDSVDGSSSKKNHVR